MSTAEQAGERRQRSIYRNAAGLEIILDVPEPPMGSGSGFIPPPIIQFFRNGTQVEFVYVGELASGSGHAAPPEPDHQ